MSKLFLTIKPTDNGVQFRVSDPAPQLVRYDKEMMPIEEVVSILQCSGESTDAIFRWLERRMQIGQFAPKGVN